MHVNRKCTKQERKLNQLNKETVSDQTDKSTERNWIYIMPEESIQI